MPQPPPSPSPSQPPPQATVLPASGPHPTSCLPVCSCARSNNCGWILGSVVVLLLLPSSDTTTSSDELKSRMTRVRQVWPTLAHAERHRAGRRWQMAATSVAGRLKSETQSPAKKGSEAVVTTHLLTSLRSAPALMQEQWREGKLCSAGQSTLHQA